MFLHKIFILLVVSLITRQTKMVRSSYGYIIWISVETITHPPYEVHVRRQVKYRPRTFYDAVGSLKLVV